MELLRTPRLVLRHWEESDLQAFYDLYSRDDVMRWLGSHPRRTMATLDEARERLGRWRARERDLDPPLGLWAIVPLAPGAPSRPPAGTVLLMPLADADGPTGLIEVGWHLHPRHQGQGFATEAADALLAAATGAGIGQVLALTDLDNVRSQAVAARLGMRDEGTTDRWFGLTARKFSRNIAAGNGGDSPAPTPPGHPEL
jgi:RimJ/RimL family protein N-acetyltransferase